MYPCSKQYVPITLVATDILHGFLNVIKTGLLEKTKKIHLPRILQSETLLPPASTASAVTVN